MKQAFSSHGAICSLWKWAQGGPLRAGNISFRPPVAGGSLSDLRCVSASLCPGTVCTVRVCVCLYKWTLSRAPGVPHLHTPLRLRGSVEPEEAAAGGDARQHPPPMVTLIPLEACVRAGGGWLWLTGLQAVPDPVSKVYGEAWDRHGTMRRDTAPWASCYGT